MREQGDTQPSWWDPYTDQPHRVPGRTKQRLAGDTLLEYLKTAAVALWAGPRVLWQFCRLSRQGPLPGAERFVGLSVSPDPRYEDSIHVMVEDLGVEEILIRMPSWDIARIDDYLRFAEYYKDKRLLINVLQHRGSVTDPAGWREALEVIFARFSALTPWFQIGNAVNRAKWGCMHTGEYLRLLEIAAGVREHHPGVRLAGSSVIDFEPLATLRTLHNRCRFRLDAVSAALYVNRRGSPFNRQFGVFDLSRKIRLIAAIAAASTRTEPRLWITETNWPLLDTQPWTPNSGHPRSTVDEPTQAQYLTDYYRIAHRTGLVEKVYWWQLISPGYGLVDHRGGSLRRHPSYEAFRALLAGGLYEPPGEAYTKTTGNRHE